MKYKYDFFEIHPCVLLDNNNNPVSAYNDPNGINFEQCDEDNPNIVCWSVYGHVPDKGLECIIDVGKGLKQQYIKERALHIQKILENKFSYRYAKCLKCGKIDEFSEWDIRTIGLGNRCECSHVYMDVASSEDDFCCPSCNNLISKRDIKEVSVIDYVKTFETFYIYTNQREV